MNNILNLILFYEDPNPPTVSGSITRLLVKKKKLHPKKSHNFGVKYSQKIPLILEDNFFSIFTAIFYTDRVMVYICKYDILKG